MEPLAEEEARTILARSWMAALGLAEDGQAHVAPVTYGYDGGVFFLQARGELDTGALEHTERACLLVTETLSETEWITVTVHGKLFPVGEDEHDLAEEILGPLSGGPSRDAALATWKLVPDELHGFRSQPATSGADEGMDVV